MAEQLLLESMQEQSRAGPHDRIGRHQLRVWKTVVDILIDDIGLVQDKIALNQYGYPAIRRHDRQVFRFVMQIHIDYLEIHPLFVEHDPAAMAERAGGG